VSESGIFGSKVKRDKPPVETPAAAPEGLVSISVRLPARTKRLFDEIAWRDRVTKQELFRLMVEAYAERYEEC
jgi:hypothetical protein